ncbi:MAG: hypothetical protein K6A65_08925 [Succinivibrionaceae bacterium]|nr:hypothetical protein [Succinivibrionaceae bacterium]
MHIELNLLESAALVVAVLYLGVLLKQGIKPLSGLCVPSPLIGGIAFSVLALALDKGAGITLGHDMDLYEITFTAFLTAISFELDIRALWRHARFVLLTLAAILVLMLTENTVSLGLGALLGVEPLEALMSGTAKMFWEEEPIRFCMDAVGIPGVEGAMDDATGYFTLCFIACTLICAPLGHRIISKAGLRPLPPSKDDTWESRPADIARLPIATFQLLVAMGIGSALSDLLSSLGAWVPGFLCAMPVAMAMNHLNTHGTKTRICHPELDYIGTLGLSLFIGACAMSIDLGTILDLTPAMVLLGLVQVACMAALTMGLMHWALGRSYESAIMGTGTLGIMCSDISCGLASMMMLNRIHGGSVNAYLMLAICSCFAVASNYLVLRLFLYLI